MHAEDWDEEFYRVESTPTLFGKPEDQVVTATIHTIGQYFIRLWLLKTPKAPKRVLGMGRRSVAGMLNLVRSIVSVLSLRFRSRAVLELENVALVTCSTFFVANDRVGTGCLR
jgi:hypothetical protein